MTSEKLLQNLREQLKSLQLAIHTIETIVGYESAEKKRKNILSTVKKRSYHGKHWTQTPEGKARLAANGRKMWREKRRQETK